MNILHSFPQVRGADLSPGVDFRIITKLYGSLLGPEYTIAAGGKYYRVGELTLSQLRRGIPACELDLLEVDPDEPEER